MIFKCVSQRSETRKNAIAVFLLFEESAEQCRCVVETLDMYSFLDNNNELCFSFWQYFKTKLDRFDRILSQKKWICGKLTRHMCERRLHVIHTCTKFIYVNHKSIFIQYKNQNNIICFARTKFQDQIQTALNFPREWNDADCWNIKCKQQLCAHTSSLNESCTQIGRMDTTDFCKTRKRVGK